MDPVVSISTYQALIAGAALLPPGGFGPFDKPAFAFRGAAPRARAARRHTANRDEVERARLRDRRGGFGAYAEPGGLAVPDAHPESAAYMADADRFHGAAAAEEREARDAAAARARAEIARRREWHAARDATLAAAQSRAEAQWDEDTAALQADGRAARKNRGGLAADPLTGAAARGPAGDALRAADAAARARAAGRAMYLAEQGVGARGENPLTGAPADAGAAVAHLAAAWGVPAPAPIGIAHATYVNASVTGPHAQVRDATRSRLSLRTMR